MITNLLNTRTTNNNGVKTAYVDVINGGAPYQGNLQFMIIDQAKTEAIQLAANGAGTFEVVHTATGQGSVIVTADNYDGESRAWCDVDAASSP